MNQQLECKAPLDLNTFKQWAGCKAAAEQDEVQLSLWHTLAPAPL